MRFLSHLNGRLSMSGVTRFSQLKFRPQIKARHSAVLEYPMDLEEEKEAAASNVVEIDCPQVQEATENISMKLASKLILEKTRAVSHGDGGTNVLYSPLSIDFLLSMVAAGSSGRTLEQLLHCLGCASVDQVTSKASKLLNRILHPPPTKKKNSYDYGINYKIGADRKPYIIMKEPPELSLANGIWIDKQFGLKDAYRKFMAENYKAKIKAVDFRFEPDKLTEEVNSWVAKATKGLISSILPQGFGIQDRQLLLANAIYFKGSWLQDFDSKQTQKRKFCLLNGETVDVPFMTNNERQFYRSYQNFKVLKMQYDNHRDARQFSMYIFLPHKLDGLQELIKNFDSDSKIFHQRFDLDNVEMKEFWIPKIEFSYGIELTKSLQELGLTLPFSPTRAELTEITKVNPREGERLYISDVIQKSFIEVNEKGTKCAVATTFRFMGSACMLEPPKHSFVADHPFLFMIREDTSRKVLFVGAVLNPH